MSKFSCVSKSAQILSWDTLDATWQMTMFRMISNNITDASLETQQWSQSDIPQL